MDGEWEELITIITIIIISIMTQEEKEDRICKSTIIFRHSRGFSFSFLFESNKV